MKYRLRCIRTYETIIPSAKMVFSTIHGATVDEMEMPESRYTRHVGQTATVSRKAEMAEMVSSGNWELVS